MPESEGPVVSLYIRQIPLQSTVLDASVTLLVGSRFVKRPLLFTLWETPVGECVSPSVSIARSLNVSLLRDALINKLDVILTHTDWVIVIDPQGLESRKAYVEAVTLVTGASSGLTA
jgi:hypothetical protein